MKRLIIIAALIASSYLLTTGSARAAAAITDFRFLPGISVGASVTDLAVTPDNRWVLVLSKAGKNLRFIDTWNFSLLSGSTNTVTLASGSTVPLCLAVSPDGKYAYVGRSDGKIAIVSLSSLNSLLPNEGLASKIVPGYVTISALNPIDSIAALPEVTGKTVNVYLLMGASSTNHLYWARHPGGTSLTNVTAWTVLHQPLSLVRGKNGVVELYKDGANSWLQVITCSDSVGCGLANPTARFQLGLSQTFVGLAVDRLSDGFVVTGRTSVAPDLWLVAQILSSITVADVLSVTASTRALSMLDKPKGLGPLVIAAEGDSVSLSEIRTASMQFSNTASLELAAPQPLWTLAASGGTDGLVYAGDTLGKVYPFSANPWISGLVATPGNTVADLDFTVNSLGTGTTVFYKVYQGETFGNWTGLLKGATVTLIAGATNVVGDTVPMSPLHECKNVLTVIAADAEGRQGRMATTVTKDAAPPAPSFKLAFGNKTIFVNFTAQSLCDLGHYEIFYGDSAGVPETLTALQNNYTKRTVASPTAGKGYSEEITGLVNNRRYYVQMVVFDKTGHSTLSARKSVVVEKPRSLTGVTGEKGGFGCALAPPGTGGGDPRDVVWLFLPAVVAIGLGRLRRRRSPE